MTIPATPGHPRHLHGQGDERGGGAQPYLLTVFFKVDGETMRMVQRSDGKLVLFGDPVVRRTDSRHDNLPPIRDGQTVAVPDKVGRTTFALQPIPLPGALGQAVVGGASGIAGVVYVLADEEQPGRRHPRRLQRPGQPAHRRASRPRPVHRRRSGGARTSPFAISDAVIQRITERITAKVKQAVKAASGPFEKFAQALNKDEIIGQQVLLFTESALVAASAQSDTDRFNGADVKGD